MFHYLWNVCNITSQFQSTLRFTSYFSLMVKKIANNFKISKYLYVWKVLSVWLQPLGRRVDLESYYKAIVAPGVWSTVQFIHLFVRHQQLCMVILENYFHGISGESLCPKVKLSVKENSFCFHTCKQSGRFLDTRTQSCFIQLVDMTTYLPYIYLTTCNNCLTE